MHAALAASVIATVSFRTTRTTGNYWYILLYVIPVDVGECPIRMCTYIKGYIYKIVSCFLLLPLLPYQLC